MDDNTVQFVLTRPEAPFLLADLAMDFASILSKEYADAMMKAGTPEKLDLNPSHRSVPVTAVSKRSRIRYKAFDGYWGTIPQIDTLVFSITP